MKKPMVLFLIFLILIYLQSQIADRQALFEGIVDVPKESYIKNQYITANIILINRGYYPDKDGILISYLLSPDGIKYREQKQIFELVPPTCVKGEYDWDADACLNSEVYTAHKTVITREMVLPRETDIGKWDFKSEYETGIQPLMELRDSFEVKGYDDTFIILVLIGLIVFYFKKK